jgi:hypothetical protein
MEDNINMINICLSVEEKDLLKKIIGKKLLNYRHDPLDKFDGETVYGRIELFFDDSIILINYDYEPFPLFGSADDEHPKFSIKKIEEEEAVSALKDVTQIDVRSNKVISEIILVEDSVDIKWDGKQDCFKLLKAIVLKFDNDEIVVQGDYMIPLLDIFKGENAINMLKDVDDEYKNDQETNFIVERLHIKL